MLARAFRKDTTFVSILAQIGLLTGSEERAEKRLVAAAMRGDRTAFDTLTRTHAKALHGFLVRRATPDAAEDILQDTWVAAWAALPRFNARSRFKAWLFGIAQHKVQDYYRARGRTPTEPLTDHENIADNRQPDPYGAIDLKHTVRGALTDLPVPQREVLEMYYYGELTLPEIAEALGRNLSTVKYQFYRAHALVADSLGPA